LPFAIIEPVNMVVLENMAFVISELKKFTLVAFELEK